MTALRRTAGRARGRCKFSVASTAPRAGSIRPLRLCSSACWRTWDPLRRQAWIRVTSPPPPREEGPHAHAVRQPGQPRGGKLRARLLQVDDVRLRTGQVRDEAQDLPGVRSEAAAIGCDVRGATLQLLHGAMLQAKHVQSIRLGGFGSGGGASHRVPCSRPTRAAPVGPHPRAGRRSKTVSRR